MNCEWIYFDKSWLIKKKYYSFIWQKPFTLFIAERETQIIAGEFMHFTHLYLTNPTDGINNMEKTLRKLYIHLTQIFQKYVITGLGKSLKL